MTPCLHSLPPFSYSMSCLLRPSVLISISLGSEVEKNQRLWNSQQLSKVSVLQHTKKRAQPPLPSCCSEQLWDLGPFISKVVILFYLSGFIFQSSFRFQAKLSRKYRVPTSPSPTPIHLLLSINTHQLIHFHSVLWNYLGLCVCPISAILCWVLFWPAIKI